MDVLGSVHVQRNEWLIAWPSLYANLSFVSLLRSKSYVTAQQNATMRNTLHNMSQMTTNGNTSKRNGSGLLIILRGEAFRIGHQHSRQTTIDNRAQWVALGSIRTKLLNPATKQGWKCATLADVHMPKDRFLHFSRHAKASAGVLSVRRRPLNGTQLKSVVTTIQWVLSPTQARLIRRTVGPWRAMVLIRADLELKTTLHLPSPMESGCNLYVPFQTLDAKGVADTILYIPRSRHLELLEVLSTRALQVRNAGSDGTPSYLDHLHSVCSWMSGFCYFLSARYDANSARDNNPLYRMIGRPERPIGVVEDIIRKKKGIARPPNARSICRHRGDASLCHERCP